MKRLLLPCIVLATPLAHAQADIEAGKAKAQVCAACHGANGVSVSDTIPNLAGQRAAYIENQLKAFKDGLRRPATPASPTATMAAIATQLSPAEMTNVAAFFASLPGASQGAKSAQLPTLAKSNVAFPDNYKQTFVKYHTINFPATRQVRHYYANKVAIDAAKANRPLPAGSYLFAEVYAAKLDAGKQPVKGKDGFFEADKLLFFTAMQSGPGWGKDFPDMLRNADWNYAAFSTEKQHRPINQAECLGCHKPLDSVSYVFTLKELGAAGR
jgi:predicted CXXCH cytochrome family protein